MRLHVGYPRGTGVFSKLQGLQYYFLENFKCNLTYYKSENFSDSSPQHIFESENFRFPFLYEKYPRLQKIVGNLLNKLRKMYIN